LALRCLVRLQLHLRKTWHRAINADQMKPHAMVLSTTSGFLKQMRDR
jgi:hypothetical protein